MYPMERNFSDRRTGKNRRRLFSLHRFHYKGPERRVHKDRRSRLERRVGYVRIDKWSSVNMQDLKIAKYLRYH
jgi:hypothetical protein